MKNYFAILALLTLILVPVLVSIFQTPYTLAQEPEPNRKVSSLLSLQVEAKVRAVGKGAMPTAVEKGYVDVMRLIETKVGDLNKQRLFIHLVQEPSQWQIAELEAMGLTLYLDSWIPPLKNHPTGFIIADMPVDKLLTLAEKDYVVSLDTAERVLEPQNYLATQKINADDVWSSGYDGTGVKIAVLDSGLDVNHNDIPTPTASWDYAEDDDTIANMFTGHGTHVTGSALGRGTQSSGVYKGSAPDANLTFLKIGRDLDGRAPTFAIVNAMHAAVDNYTADIITMSYGGWDTYHDGTSPEAQAVDYAVSKGAVVFISAGNEANDDAHYSGTVSANTTTDYIQVNVSGAGTDDTTLWFNLVWYDGLGIHNTLSGQFYDSIPSTIPTVNEEQTESTRGTEARMCYIGPSEGSYYAVPSGTYYVKVTNSSDTSQDFHIYVWATGAGSVTFENADPDYTIGSPADADSAITVGAYTTRKYWWNYKNVRYHYTSEETVDQIVTFSSRGPRVDTDAPPKPNIVAPGSAIISCRDDDIYPVDGKQDPPTIDNDGPNTDNVTKNNSDPNDADYYVMQGTSMASPHAAGVAALILDKNPTWTPAQVKHAIESTATDKGASDWDKIYGWGLIDALAAVNSSLPTWESYKGNYGDSSGTAEDYFDDCETEHQVYMYGTDFNPDSTYKVIYWDGAIKRMVDSGLTPSADGKLKSSWIFEPEQATAGYWQVTVYTQYASPSSYSAADPNIVADDVSCGNYAFHVTESAIPEFPTVLAAIFSLALCSGIYLWMRRRLRDNP